MLRFTLLTSAIASATFAATLAFAPGALETGQRLLFGAPETNRVSAPAVTAPERECSPFAKIIAGLQHRPCP